MLPTPPQGVVTTRTPHQRLLLSEDDHHPHRHLSLSSDQANCPSSQAELDAARERASTTTTSAPSSSHASSSSHSLWSSSWGSSLSRYSKKTLVTTDGPLDISDHKWVEDREQESGTTAVYAFTAKDRDLSIIVTPLSEHADPDVTLYGYRNKNPLATSESSAGTSGSG